METQRWTMVELVARVAAALDGATYAGAPNGRVRDVPDARAVRWYATIGLVDRPAAMRGRTALYGPRHLLQLVAVKRRQAEGRSIAEIQAELAGAPDETLREIAGIPEGTPATVPPGSTASPAGSTSTPAAGRRFWAASASAAAADGPTVHLDRAPEAEPEPVHTPGPVAVDGLLTGIPLGGGVVLLVPSVPRQTDLAAIAVAAAPLIDLLVARDLIIKVDPALFSHRSSLLPDDEPGATVSINHSTDSRTDVTR